MRQPGPPTRVSDLTSSAKCPPARLGDHCSLVNGDAYRDTDWSTQGVPIVRIQNLNDHSKPFNFWAGSLDDRVRIKDGDLLLAWSGTPGTSFGAHIWSRGEAVLNQHIFRVDLEPTRIDAQYACFAVNYSLEALILKAHGGVGLRHVTKREVEALELPLPPLPEQRRIAARLKEQLAEVARARKAAAAQEAYSSCLYASALRQHVPMPGCTLPGDWIWTSLGSLIVDSRNGFGRRPSGTEVGTVVLRLADVGEGVIRPVSPRAVAMSGTELRTYDLRNGDLLFVRVNGSSKLVGRCVLVGSEHESMSFNDHLIRVRLRPGISPQYVRSVAESPWARAHFASAASTSAGQLTINRDSLDRLPIPLPPFAKQEELADRLDSIQVESQRVQGALRRKKHTLAALPAALLRASFQGGGVG